jgi:hypothetical protein
MRGEEGLNRQGAAAAPREVREYLAILDDPLGRAAVGRLLHAYESRIWYLGQIEMATTELLHLLDPVPTETH